MSKHRERLRGAVLAWTIFTTTFTWTPTMRLLLKPEISKWSVFGLAGSGRTGAYWIFPLIALTALLLFYLEGRGRLRPLVYALLLAWHLPLTAALIYSSVRTGHEATFMGAAWGVEIPLYILALPFAFFSVLAVLWITWELRGLLPVPRTGWGDVHWPRLAVALLLLPVAFVFFALGEGFDARTKIAIATTVLQWILLADGLGKRAPRARTAS